MTPFWSDDHLTLYGGDCRAVMASMEPESVHCVVTSPPYWGLRDYGTEGQLGLEPTPEAYVANMVDVFREVRRVLRDDGTLWLNLGDSYWNHSPVRTSSSGAFETTFTGGKISDGPTARRRANGHATLKMKDLVGIPWMVAFALQADGWYLRSDIIWAKPNPMPESVTDRPTKAHEYLFLLSKSARYYFDAEAVREAVEPHNREHNERYVERSKQYRVKLAATDARNDSGQAMYPTNPAGRNLRTVWIIATEPYPGAHFATFPRKLVEPCVKAGTSERGVCPECGAPWERVVEFTGEIALSPDMYGRPRQPVTSDTRYADGDHLTAQSQANGGPLGFGRKVNRTTGWRSPCAHAAEPVPAVVLDPFAGSGTTLLVAQALGRKGVGIDLSPEYLKQAIVRSSRHFGKASITEDTSLPTDGLWETA